MATMPPISGPGSSVDAWRAYAVEVLDLSESELLDLSRAEIIDLLPNPETPSDVELPADGPKAPFVDARRLREAIRGRTPDDGKGIVEQALVAERLLAPKYADGRFGSMATRAMRRWQRGLGLRGHDADGIPDYTSLKHLGDKHGFNVGGSDVHDF